MVDTKGVGQPWKCTGEAGEDFQEWIYKTKTFMLARFGLAIEGPLNWAARQRKHIVVTAEVDDKRAVGWIKVWGVEADEVDRVENLAVMVPEMYTYLVSFTGGDGNKIVRNSGQGHALEACTTPPRPCAGSRS